MEAPLHAFSFSQTDITLANTTHKEILSEIRKETNDLYNRLHSVAEDSEFVTSIKEIYSHYPILPNLRCGAWYTDPKLYLETTPESHELPYFKSTDGHYGNWSSNLRRPNLHLLPIIISGGGLIIVDSTRAGKRFPDALSKTVPIWCCIINRAIHRRHPEIIWDDSELNLFTPPGAVSEQEHSQICIQLDSWTNALCSSSYDLPMLPRPLRPLWVSPGSADLPRPDGRFLPVICASASRQVHEGQERRSTGYVYVQGSGDDHELWAQGLTPAIFWRHRDDILRASRQDLPLPIAKVDGRMMIWSWSEKLVAFDFSTVNARSIPEMKLAYVVVTASNIPAVPPVSCTDDDDRPVFLISSPSGKKGQIHFLQTVLPKTMDFIGQYLRASSRNAVCVCCDDGRDISVGITLAALQQFFDDSGHVDTTGEERNAGKNTIRTRLHWIIASHPAANPSRTTLKRVNEFLLTSSSYRSTRKVQ